MSLTYNYFIEYLPKCYLANIEQDIDRKKVYAFKDGYCPDDIKDKFADIVIDIASGNKRECIVLFIPVSSNYKTRRRFSGLASYFKNHSCVEATIKGIENLEDTESMCMTGRSCNKTESYQFNTSLYKGKNIILIHDVITLGISFSTCAKHLLSDGISSVKGLFLANTINPVWAH